MTTIAMPVVRIENTGGDQQFIPFTFGQIFVAGHLKSSDGLAAKPVSYTHLTLPTNREV